MMDWSVTGLELVWQVGGGAGLRQDHGSPLNCHLQFASSAAIASASGSLTNRISLCHLPEISMNRAIVLQLLRESKLTLAERFGVTDLALFGSTARDTAREDSDIDVLVHFDGPATSDRFFGVQFFLEDLFGRPIDLVSGKALRAELRPFVEQDAVHV
jgi:predicted nucleotidyltransferase